MKKWILRLAGASVLAAVLILLLAWLRLRASLPTLEGAITVAGLGAAAIIERDAEGMATITAATRADAAFATGFAHGQDRFFQMDIIRRRSAGEVSALVGAVALDLDRRFRLHRFRMRAQASLATLPRGDLEILERYAAGVNAGLASLAAKPFEYYVLGVEPLPWQPEDTILVAYSMFLNLNDERADRDIRRGLAHRVLPPEMFAFMYPQGTPWDAPLMGEPRATGPVPAASVMSTRDVVDEAPSAGEIGKPDLNGSNNWAVGGALTANGRALIANDMHLGLTVPGIWYRARLIVTGGESRDVTGVTLPGTPFMIGGSNTMIAWGNTNSYGDWSDAVVLRPGADAQTYRTRDGDLPFVEVVEKIEVKGGDAVDLVVRETVWGPVHDKARYPDGVREGRVRVGANGGTSELVLP